MKTSVDKLSEHYSENNESINISDNIRDTETKNSSINLKSQFSYPELSDTKFNLKITNKKEFLDNISFENNIDDIEKISNEICNQDFQLAPHQIFIRNFMSKLTPYNSLLLYHGLGTGKTCSAIGVSEEMRLYMKEMNIKRKILIIASPNVQENFRLQLFDERKLKQLENGSWDIMSCVGKSFYNEVNLFYDLEKKEEIIEKINLIIDKNYEFMGYTKLATLIEKKKKKSLLKETFEGRLIIIDEVHNIRPSEQKQKKIFNSLNYLVKEVSNIRLLLLSATPMFNNYKEIIQIINILLNNEKRDLIIENEIFDKNGNFIINEEGEEIGKIKFIQKINGLISFVQGENPFSFPFRIFPKMFNPDNSFIEKKEYPKFRLDNSIILTPLEHIDIYPVELKGIQKDYYSKVINNIISKNKTETIINDEEDRIEENQINYGYSTLQEPLECLNIVFPNTNTESDVNDNIGKRGLSRIVENIDVLPYNFKDEYLDTNKRSMFSIDNIENYSIKLKTIGEEIKKNKGITLIFSQYIYGGVIPAALLLEEMGFIRYGENDSFLSNSYRKSNNIQPFMINGKQATYSMITSNINFSKDNKKEIIAATNEENIDGDIIKVILITKAGSEGIDFKNIRSIHIIDPWYNMNRIEQIIGRGVRNCSHKLMKLSERNVLIYLYGCYYDNTECVDMYVYRGAEKKAVQIGKISRILKSHSIDCLLQSPNRSYLDVSKLITITLPNGNQLEYNLNNLSYTSNCDYMKSCAYKCGIVNDNKINDITIDDVKENEDSYDINFLETNLDSLKQQIQNLFYEKYIYNKDELFYKLQIKKHYPKMQILKALDDLSDNNEYIYDKYGQQGYIIHVDNLYIFQPINILNKKISINDRMKPIDEKIKYLDLVIKDTTANDNLKDSAQDNFNYSDEYSEFVSEDIYKDVLTILKDNYDNSEIDKISFNYFLEMLPFEKRKQLFMYYVDNKDNTESKTLDNLLFNVINEKIIEKENTNIKLYLLSNGNELIPFVYKNNNWDIGNEIYLNEFSSSIKEKFYFDKINGSDYLGLLLPSNKSSKHNVTFKIKNMLDMKTKSAVCNNFNLLTRNNILKSSFGIEKYEKNKKKIKTLNSSTMCLLIEMIMRYNQLVKLDNKTWFLNPEESIYNKKMHKTLKF